MTLRFLGAVVALTLPGCAREPAPEPLVRLDLGEVAAQTAVRDLTTPGFTALRSPVDPALPEGAR